MKNLTIILILLLFNSCITIKTEAGGNFGGGLVTNEKNSKKILKRVRKKSIGGKLGLTLFEYKNSEFVDKTLFSNSELKFIKNEVQRIADLVKTIGDQNWYSSTFGVRNELVPAIEVKIEANTNLSANTDCDNNKVIVSTGLLQKIYRESLLETFEMNTEMLDDYGSDFMEFKINNETEYFTGLFNLKGKNLTIFNAFNDDDADDRYFDNVQTALELERTANFASMEYLKSLLFILSHETYHKISDCKVSKEIEIEADIFGSVVYQLLFQNQNNNPEGIAGLLFGDLQENVVASNTIRFIQGREIYDIVEETYQKTPFEKGSAIHLPLEERVSFILEKVNMQGVDALFMTVSTKLLEYSHN
ncbi:hypothetical protein [Maribacter sp. 4G9]|uniref:hypothetical protein n=1 Tax=Maribacter sp. 4G9 TaxID=1889777 RepID=UPI000C157961|nr:hypothetical protein [Maribacter sp. 4G9]PIB26445.1 hypothetical protein BFP75_08345 [Maribacter sp. 4G9]